MVTTTMRMLDGVHCYSSNARPVLLLCLGLEVGIVGSEQRLVTSLAASNHTDHGSARTLDCLSNTRGETNAGLFAVFGVTNDDAGSSRGSGEGATISKFGFNAADNGAFGHGVYRQDIADL